MFPDRILSVHGLCRLLGVAPPDLLAILKEHPCLRPVKLAEDKFGFSWREAQAFIEERKAERTK